MNERIKELAEQAWNMVEDTNRPLLFAEKFAKLIVGECAGIYDAIDNGNLVEGTDDYLEALRKTFRS